MSMKSSVTAFIRDPIYPSPLKLFRQLTKHLPPPHTHTQQYESSRRYGEQLEQKKLVAVSVSRHASTDDAPRVEVYKKKKWCTLCDVEVKICIICSTIFVSLLSMQCPVNKCRNTATGDCMIYNVVWEGACVCVV